MAQIQRLVASAQGKDRSREERCLVTVIGSRLTTKSGYSFEHPEVETLIVHAIGIGFAEPTTEQEGACRALWLSSRTAPAAYQFPSDRLPVLADGCGSTTNPATPAGAAEETEA
jgi:hypothetical protein